MRYAIKHVTRFTYDDPISESVMEARMQPRSGRSAALPDVRPANEPTRSGVDIPGWDENTVHYFDILETTRA